MSEELEYQLGLELIPGIGQKGVKQLISYCGSASQVFKTPKNRLLKIPGVGHKIADAIKSARTFAESKQIIQSCEEKGIQLVHYLSKDYPHKLKQIHDAPNVLYCKGAGELNCARTVAVVGARKATSYGKAITERIVSDLATIDWCYSSERTCLWN